jgi:general secretion pathway protein D
MNVRDEGNLENAMRNVLVLLLVSSLCFHGLTARADQPDTNAAPQDSQPAQPATAPSDQPTNGFTVPTATEAPAETPPPSDEVAPAPPSEPAAAEPLPAPPPVNAAEAERIAREEAVRRQSAHAAARRLIDEGMKLYHAGRYEEAVDKLRDAIRILPRAKLTEADYNRAARALTDSYYRLADAALRANDYAKARDYAQRALQYDPRNRAAENLLVKISRAEQAGPPPPPEGPPSDKTPEFTAKKDEIRRLFREGKILMNSGQYDEAEKRYKQVLLIDRYNNDAYVYLDELNKVRQESAIFGQDATRSRRLWEVSDAWAPPIGGEVLLPQPGRGTPTSTTVARQAEIAQKLNDITIPEVNFREAALSDVVTFLHDESVRLDPQHIGVNFVLSPGVSAPTTPPPPPPAAPGAAPPEAGAVHETATRPITLSLRNVPLIELVKYVTTLANLKYRIEQSAVLILPKDAPEGQMVTRYYNVNPGVFYSSIVVTNYPASTRSTQQAGGGGGGVQAATALVQAGPDAVLPTVFISILSNTVKQAFIDAGVPFPGPTANPPSEGSSFYFNERTSTIIIRNTPENLEIFERVLAAFNVIPPQVEIEAKLIEISQSDLDELGFDWAIGGHRIGSDVEVRGGSPPSGPFEFTDTSGSAPPDALNNPLTQGNRDSTTLQGNAVEALLAASGFGTLAGAQNQVATVRGILTNPQFEVIIKALAQKKSADLLSAPKVTTISGAQAQIRVAQEFIYPTTFTAPTAVAAGGGVTGGGAAAVTPSIPSGFTSRAVGVVLNVTPTVGADGYTVNLTLIPQVTDFLGFINYGGPIAVAAGNNVVTTFNDIKQPLFSTRDIVTSVVVWDGQTVVLGGLIREDLQKIDDKVPFLGDIPIVGRLFRSKVTVRNKRNLLIFVTARLVDPAGNPVHRQAEPTTTASAR